MNLDLLQSLTLQLDCMRSFGAGYSAGSGIPEVAVLGGRGVRACLSWPATLQSQFKSQNPGYAYSPVESLDRKHLCHPPFFSRMLTVRSRHNPRLFMTKGTIELLEMRQH